MRRYLSSYCLLAPRIYIAVVKRRGCCCNLFSSIFAHIPFVVNHTLNATGEVATAPRHFTISDNNAQTQTDISAKTDCLPLFGLFKGTRSRIRIHSCGLPADSQEEACGRAPFFGTWSLWGSCSRTCGGGQQTRSRVGFCGNQDETEVYECKLLKVLFILLL